jgi:DNA-binding NtrC family response regulator
VTPLGASLPVPVDVRIVAATNRDLEEEVRTGRFRVDLFYRLNVVHVTLPPLRDRRDDIPVLVEHLIQRFSQQYGVAPKRVTPEALERLNAHAWPGNVRELQNVIERAFALSISDTITVADLPGAVAAQPLADAVPPDGAAMPTLGDAERRLIAAALRKSGGNKNEAARMLGIDRQRLYRKIDKYGL